MLSSCRHIQDMSKGAGLSLLQEIVSKPLYDGAQEFRYGAHAFRLSLGSVHTLATLVLCPNNMPVERHRDKTTRWLMFLSIAHFALPPDLLQLVMGADPHERDAWLMGYARSTQQKLK